MQYMRVTNIPREDEGFSCLLCWFPLWPCAYLINTSSLSGRGFEHGLLYPGWMPYEEAFPTWKSSIKCVRPSPLPSFTTGHLGTPVIGWSLSTNERPTQILLLEPSGHSKAFPSHSFDEWTQKPKATILLLTPCHLYSPAPKKLACLCLPSHLWYSLSFIFLLCHKHEPVHSVLIILEMPSQLPQPRSNTESLPDNSSKTLLTLKKQPVEMVQNLIQGSHGC